MKALSVLLTCASPIATMELTEEVCPLHAMSDFNAGTVSQTMIQITALTNETYFAMQSPAILAVARMLMYMLPGLENFT